MKVWIEQDLCTGDGLCEEICPSVFELDGGGIAHVKAEGQPSLYGEDGNPANVGSTGMVDVSVELISAVEEAAEECPGECIFIVND